MVPSGFDCWTASGQALGVTQNRMPETLLYSGIGHCASGSRHTMPRGPLDSDGRAFNKGLRHDAVSAAPRTPLGVAGKTRLRMSEVTESAGRRSEEAAFGLPWLDSATGRCHPKPPEVSFEAPLTIKQ